MARRWHHAVLMASALLPLAAASALAGPNGATVVGGAATVQGQGTANVVVNQSSQNAIINWQTFNIGSGETTKIYMPNSSSAELDRVTGGLGPSQILGSLSSNGKVFLVNPDGILFGMGARINVGSLLATTNDIANSDFMAGRYNFSIPGNPNASIVNHGDDHGADRRLRRAGGAGRAQHRHHHGEARHHRARLRQRVHARHLWRQSDHARAQRLDRLAGHRCLDRPAAEIAGQQRGHAQGQRRHRGADRGRGARRSSIPSSTIPA